MLPLHIYLFPPEPYVPYTIEVSAATHAGEGDVNTIIDFTEEGSACTINTKAFQPKRPTARNCIPVRHHTFHLLALKLHTDRRYVLRG